MTTNDAREALRDAIRATEYKYFGDYEMSDDQRKAVDVLVAHAEASLALSQDNRSSMERLGEILRETNFKPTRKYLGAAFLGYDYARRYYASLPAPAPAQEAVASLCQTCLGMGYLRKAPSTCAAGGDLIPCPVCCQSPGVTSKPSEPASDPCKLAAGEVVAWKYTDADGVEFSDMRWPAGVVAAQGWTETPLYAAPQPPEQCALISHGSSLAIGMQDRLPTDSR